MLLEIGIYTSVSYIACAAKQDVTARVRMYKLPNIFDPNTNLTVTYGLELNFDISGIVGEILVSVAVLSCSAFVYLFASFS